VIDLALFDQGDSFRQEAAATIREACVKTGFFYIAGHGIDIGLQKRLEDLSAAFFAMPLADKMSIDMAQGGPAWRGYFPVGGELTSGIPDLKEGIYFGQELALDHPKVKAGVPMHGANLFPSLPGFRETVLTYMQAVTELGHRLMGLLSLSLNLPESYLDQHFTKDPLILFRIFHYPPDEHATNKAMWGVGEHTDYGLLTILKQDDCGGLQVKTGSGWVDAPPIENTFVCNIGDMLERMTGGLYKSTLHRVRNLSGRERYSYPLFFDPGFDVRVAPLPGTTILSASSHERWDQRSVFAFEGTYGDYVLEKVSKVFPALKSYVKRP
jgi:isopenicillin N synthase-like dioxygenase